MGLITKLTGLAISNKLEAYTAANPAPADYPAADLQKLESIAGSVAARLPELATELGKVLPKKLPAESQLPPDARNLATKLGQYLLSLVPKSLADQVAATRDQARDGGVDYEKARLEYGKIRGMLPAVPYFVDKVPAGLVAFAAQNGVTPAELQQFEDNLKKLHAMIPLVEMAGPDIVARLKKIDELAGLASLADNIT